MRVSELIERQSTRRQLGRKARLHEEADLLAAAAGKKLVIPASQSLTHRDDDEIDSNFVGLLEDRAEFPIAIGAYLF